MVKPVDYHTHLKAEEFINGAHPFSITPGQVIVDCDNMDTFSGQGIEVRR